MAELPARKLAWVAVLVNKTMLKVEAVLFVHGVEYTRAFVDKLKQRFPFDAKIPTVEVRLVW